MHRARKSALDRLKASEARAVLTRLLSLYPDLISAAERAAEELLAEVDHLSVADRVVRALKPLGGGDEATRWRAIEAALSPFMEDAQRRRDLSLREPAEEIEQGILLGLYRLKDDREGPMRGAPTLARELAEWVVERGQERGATPPSEGFLKGRTPEWAGLLGG
ncbi:hypothetical protein KKF91_00480 [Myxococcota bacterium]|nr:hypothetical protein [Myxococcota bacterium]MBU1429010.1 hypothetical protein [Myxococcota bacterium]MBU1898434.1 hypothetical protein [Myxococcota bacterium]